MSIDETYMRHALDLAALGWGRTNPNPLVGAVIVRDDEVIGEGYHARVGEAHAELAALQQARLAHHDVHGATLYVTLEPCSHQGRTPPCTGAIIESGIHDVVIAMHDPNPLVAGNGIRQLQAAGIRIRTGILEQEACKLNEIFIKYITRHKPFVILKSAMTLDGKIASVSGDSRWISCEKSRQHVHRLRDRVAAIMVGSHTVLTDDPFLTARLPEGQGMDPVRIVVDSAGRIPLTSHVIKNNSAAGMILATTSRIPYNREIRYQECGIKIIKLDGPDEKVDLAALMRVLADLEIDSVLIEGGGGLNAAALTAGIVDKVLLFIAPKIIGGEKAITSVEGAGITLMRDAIRLEQMTCSHSGEDILIEGYLASQ
jgi:diaminohydroxyphosphoribosylaminopyrimidine deaminase/5-amino-6-(5-phosphoribosylamino)uracil reductase